jgi:hypothetical protein
MTVKERLMDQDSTHQTGEFYPEVKEAIPLDAPEERGLQVAMMCYWLSSDQEVNDRCAYLCEQCTYSVALEAPEYGGDFNVWVRVHCDEDRH